VRLYLIDDFVAEIGLVQASTVVGFAGTVEAVPECNGRYTSR
jgi:hypothetical protein